MPNKVHVPRCPYYLDEQKKTITCEDVYRSFDDLNHKWGWMKMYCDSWDWMRCPYAMDLNEAYDRLEKGDEEALIQNERDSLKRELKSLSIKLGKAEKRIERQQRKIDDLRGVNQSLVNVNTTLENKNRTIHQKWKDLSDRMEKYEEKVSAQVMTISETYETRLACLMDKYTDGKLYESDVREWAKDRHFAIIYDQDEDRMEEPFFRVVFQEEGENEDDRQKSEDIPVSIECEKTE